MKSKQITTADWKAAGLPFDQWLQYAQAAGRKDDEAKRWVMQVEDTFWWQYGEKVETARR